MRLYYYKSATVPQFAGPYDVGTPSARKITAPDGAVYDVLYGPIPENGIYEATVATNPPPDQYYDAADPPVSIVFSGAEGDAAARVVETNEWVSWSLADIYDSKTEDISEKDRSVRYNALDTSLSVNWWIIVTERARSEIYSLNDAALNRKIDGAAWPSGNNQPFIAIYNAVNTNVRRERIPNQSTWETIILELAQHDQATGNATEASGDDLDVRYNNGAGTREDVVAHNPDDPSWGYPPTIETSGTAAVIFG